MTTRRVLLALALATVTSSWPSLASSSSPARVVIVVGYNGGAPDPRAPLSFADDDAARLFKQLAPTSVRSWLLTTFDRESARVSPDLTEVARPPTKEALAGALGEAFWVIRQRKAKGEETELVFAFAGHGDVDDSGRGFIVMADGPFTRDDLAAQVLEASPADINHVIVDACSSYFFVKSRGGAGDDVDAGVPLTPALLNVLAPAGSTGLSQAARARTGLLVSTSTATEVHESSTLSAGVFSYLLRSALTGVADVDGNGRVEYAETAAFVAQASMGLADPRARLQIHAEAPLQRPHSALTRLDDSGGGRFLAVDSRSQKHLRLLDPRGVPYAEVHTTGDAPVYVALVGEPFFLVQEEGKEAVLVPREAGAYALSALTFADVPQARGLNEGLLGLFHTPFGAEFVRGYVAQTSMTAPQGLSPSEAGSVTTFEPAFAAAGSPPMVVPVGVIGGVTLGAAGVVGVAAGAAVVGNQVAFSALESNFSSTGELDPKLVLEVEGWRGAATALTVGAVSLGVLGASLLFWSTTLEDGGVRLP